MAAETERARKARTSPQATQLRCAALDFARPAPADTGGDKAERRLRAAAVAYTNAADGADYIAGRAAAARCARRKKASDAR